MPRSSLNHRSRDLLVPGLVLLSVVLLVASFAFAGDTFHDCHYYGPSLRMYLAGWVGVPALPAAVLVSLLGRPGGRPAGLARAALVLVPVLLLAQAFVLYTLYASDPAGGSDCSGLGLLDRGGVVTR